VDKHEYYSAIFPRLANSFDHASWVLAQGPELIRRGWDPDGLLVTVEPIGHLYDLSVKDGMEVFLPVIGKNKTVLAPIDFEIFLSHETWKIYADAKSQGYYHNVHIKPISDFFESLLQGFQIPYLLDLTPSGGHILFHAEQGTNAYRELASIGWLEQELVEAYIYRDADDLKRSEPCGFEAGSVFSGIGRLWNYASLLAKEFFKDAELPITICDSEDKCVNIDNSWQADPAYMRILRSPYSLHRKNIHKHNMPGNPLCDVIKTHFDGQIAHTNEDLQQLVQNMWDLEQAAIQSDQFSGHIPVANDSLIPLIRQYQQSKLYEFVSDFDRTPDLQTGEGLHRARNDPRLSEKSRSVIEIPYPRMMQPNTIKKFVRNMTDIGWHPKHIACLMNDLYTQPQHNWRTNWLKYTSRTRANYWARTYSAINLIEAGVPLVGINTDFKCQDSTSL